SADHRDLLSFPTRRSSDLLAGISAGLAGIIIEQLVIRHFYNQLLSSLVVTWGLSLIISQGTLLLLGPSVMNMPTPFGSFKIGPLDRKSTRLKCSHVKISYA